jgi:hypothetical protein
MLQGLATFRATSSKLQLPHYLTTLADGYGMTGQPQGSIGSPKRPF